MSHRIVLGAGALELHLLPHAGGSIARFDRSAGSKRQPLFRGTDEGDAGPLDGGCFPLVPYCNRIRGGRFDCDGDEVQLAPNMPPDPSPLHGQGWLSRWDVISSSAAHATLRFAHSAGEWPWSYEAQQHFVLDHDGLSVVLTCRNTSARPMPCGLGLHPYFPCDRDTRLDTRVTSAWTVDENVLPVAQVPATGVFDLRDRAICSQGLDNGFGGWSGLATIDWPGAPAALRMSVPAAHYFQVYSPESGGLFVVEPVQHANAALNAPQQQWSDLGLCMLAKGEQRELRVRFDVIVAGSDQPPRGSAAT